MLSVLQIISGQSLDTIANDSLLLLIKLSAFAYIADSLCGRLVLENIVCVSLVFSNLKYYGGEGLLV